MSENENDARAPGIREDGFEWEGEFYRWRVGDTGKDLMLIDRFSALPIDEFFEIVDDEHERFRAPILLTLIACSIRAAHPEWTVERITRAVMSLQISALTFVSGDEETVDDDSPLAPSERPTISKLSVADSNSAGDASSRSSTPEDSSAIETSYATPA